MRVFRGKKPEGELDMKKRYTDRAIIRILKQVETGIPVPDLLREYNILLSMKGQVRVRGDRYNNLMLMR